MTSAWSFWAENHESSPNLPSLYLVRSRSFGKPQTTDTRCGRVLLFVSASVENRMAALLINRVVVQQIDCMARIQCHTNTHTALNDIRKLFPLFILFLLAPSQPLLITGHHHHYNHVVVLSQEGRAVPQSGDKTKWAMCWITNAHISPVGFVFEMVVFGFSS